MEKWNWNKDHWERTADMADLGNRDPSRDKNDRKTCVCGELIKYFDGGGAIEGRCPNGHGVYIIQAFGASNAMGIGDDDWIERTLKELNSPVQTP